MHDERDPRSVGIHGLKEMDRLRFHRTHGHIYEVLLLLFGMKKKNEKRKESVRTFFFSIKKLVDVLKARKGVDQNE